MVLFDFRGANIDMCCAMIDAMGQFLYLSVDSHGKMKVLLEVMMKKRAHVRDFCQQVHCLMYAWLFKNRWFIIVKILIILIASTIF